MAVHGPLTVTYAIMSLVCLAESRSHMQCPVACTCPTSAQHSSSSDVGTELGIAVTCADAGLSRAPAELPTDSVSLDVSGNRLDALSSASLPRLDSVQTLTTANFSRNRIVTIARSSFSDWKELVSLDMSANRLSSIDHGTFRGAAQTSLQNLDLSGNRLTDVDGGFSGMTNLFRLDLRNNYLTSLTEFTFRDLSGLRYLFLTNNRIYRIERRSLRHLHHLLYLVLRGNPLADTDRLHFHTPSALSYIDVSECGLIRVPRGLPNTLRYVQLRRNNLTTIDDSTFSECPHINILVLDENTIQTVHNGSFAALSRLQQLWLNENHLKTFPRPLPASLRRLLVDNNRIDVLDDNDTFAVRSQLTTVSLAGNQLQRLSPTVLQRLTNLQSLDLSNNQLRHILAATFAGNTQLRSLTLANNPLETIEAGAFDELRSLKALTLSYVPSVDVQMSPGSLFRPVPRLSRLDLDNSPGMAKAIMWPASTDNDERPSNVEELGLINCALTTFPRSFPRRFPRLTALRISSSQWHCDRAMMWFRDWLLDADVDVRVQAMSDIRCATPMSVRHRPIVSLNDNEFVETTTTKPQRHTSTTTTTSTSTSTTTSPSSAHSNSTAKQLGLIEYDDYSEELEETKEPLPSKNSTSWQPDSYMMLPEVSGPKVYLPTTSSSPGHRHESTSRSRHQSGHRPRSHPDKHHHRRHKDEFDVFVSAGGDEDDYLLIAVLTVSATFVVAACIVVAIVYVCRRTHKPSPTLTSPTPPLSTDTYDDETLQSNGGASPTPRTFIKYKNKNGVLYFSTPAAADSLTTTVGDDSTTDSCLIGQTDAGGTDTMRYVLPPSSAGLKTRVYRWEDF